MSETESEYESEEEFKYTEIEGYENYIIYEDGRVLNKKRGEFKTPYLRGKKGKQYLNVRLYKNGDGKHLPLHRLLALAFIPNPNNKPCCDHIDKNPLNNSLNNLRWSTISENNRNRNKNSNNTSGYKNVSWDKHYKLWRVRINRVFYGLFKDIDAAGMFAAMMSAQINGEFHHDVDAGYESEESKSDD